MAVDNTTIGSVLTIPSDLISNLEKVDEKIKKIQESSRATASTFNTQFASMTSNTNFLINNLDRIISQLGTIGGAAQTASQATQGMGQGMGAASQGATSFGNSITSVIQAINQMIGHLQQTGQIGTSSLMAAKLAADKLMEAMQYKNTGSIALIKEEISGIDKQLKDTENLLTKTQQDALVERKRLLQEELKEAQRTQKEREVNLQRTLDRMSSAEQKYQKQLEQSYKKTAEQYRAQNYASNTTYEGSVKFAESANTINRRLKAIEYLREARAKLTTQDGEYAKKLEEINAAIKRLDKANRDAVASSKNLGTAYESLTKSHHNLLDTAGQLQRAFALMFSVSQIRGYISQIAKVRGEFELQQRSLEAILQNKTEADAIFNKTVALAVQSPFQIKDLISYTKQLAAYRIESDKLYDTTKRLADVSAGLGVDMQRLILAYGQVKAAAYLRGTEVRQFTEAGINLYGELQAYFKEVKGEAYTTAQIVDMISKRMVTFEDVEAIFRRITDQGGIFYNMQAIQAETLQGKIANLKDSIDVMLNDIGKANEGAFKGTIDFANTLIRNWESVANVGKAIIAVFALVKLNSMMMGRTMTEVFLRFSKFQKISSAAKGVDVLSLAFKNVGIAAASAGRMITMAFKANAGLLGITAGVAAVYSLLQWISDYRKELQKVAVESGKLKRQLNDINNSFEEADKLDGGFGVEAKEKALERLKKLVADANLKVEITVEESKDVDAYFSKLKSKYEEYVKFKRVAETALVENNQRWEWGGLLGDNIDEDAKNFTDAYNTIIGKTSELDTAVSMLYDRYDKLSDVQKKILDEGTKRQEGQSEVEYLRQQSEAVKKVTELFGATLNTSILRIREYNKNFRYYLFNFGSDNSYDNTRSELLGEIDNVIERIKKRYSAEDWRKVGEDVIRSVIDGMAADKGWTDEVKEQFYKAFNVPITIDKNSLNNSLNEADAAIRDFFARKKYTIKINAKEDNNTAPNLDDLNKTTDEYIKRYKQLRKEIKQLSDPKADKELLLSRFTNYGKLALPKSEYDRLLKQAINEREKELSAIKAEVIGMGRGDELITKDDKNAAKVQRDLLRERIDAYKELQSQYEKYLKMYDKNTAKTKALESLKYKLQNAGIYGDAVGIFPDEKTIAEKIKGLAAQYKELSKRGDAYKIVADLLLQIDQEKLKNELDAAKTEIDDAFSGLNVYTDLKKLGLGESDIANMFGELPKTFDDVQKKINEIYNGKEGTEWVEKRKEAEKKLQEQIVKYNLDTFKELTKAYGQQLDEQLQLDQWYVEEKKKINEVVTDPELRAKYEENLKKKYEQKSDENSWKEFQNSEFYIKIFENLDTTSSRVLDAMSKRLQDLRGSLKNLSPEQLKQVVSAMEQINTESVSRNPFKNLSKNIKEFIAFQKSRNKLEKDFLDSADKEGELKKQSQEQSKIVQQRKEEYDAAVKTYGAMSGQAGVAYNAYMTEKAKLDVILAELVAQGKITKEMADQIRKGEQLKKTLKDQVGGIADQFSQLASGWGEMESMLQSFGVELPEEIGGALNGLSQASGGIKKILDGDIIGGTFSTIAGIGNSIANIFGFGSKDNKLQKQIEEQQRAVERLQRAYEKLEESISNAFTAQDLNTNTHEAIENLRQQNADIERMIALENDKKDSDSGQIEEWYNQIQDNREEIERLLRQQTEEMGGFGDKANYKSAAQAFADAWVDAFNEASDTLQALEDTFDDYFDNLLKKQIMQSVVGKYINPVLEQIDKIVQEGSLGGTNGLQIVKEEIDGVLETWNNTKGPLNDFLTGLFDVWGLSPRSSSTLSQLQQGIQSLTESTGQALESLLNSIRFFVAQQSTDVAAIRQLLAAGSGLNTTTDTNTPMLKELQAQTNYLSKMYSLWSSVIKSGGHPKAGAGIKVFQD